MITSRWIPAVMLGTVIAFAVSPSTTGAQTPASPAPQGAAQPPAPAAPPRPTPPTRDPATPGYVKATELPTESLLPTDADGNFIIGPTHTPAPEATAQDDGPQG